MVLNDDDDDDDRGVFHSPPLIYRVHKCHTLLLCDTPTNRTK